MAKLEFRSELKKVGEGFVCVFFLRGNIQKKTACAFAEKIANLQRQQIEIFILQMQGVELLDTSGIEFLVETADTGEELGCEFYLTGVHAKCKAILYSLGVNTLLPIYNHQDMVIDYISGRNSQQTVETRVETGLPEFNEQDLRFLDILGALVDKEEFELPVLPDIALKLSQLVDSPRSSAEEIEKLIATDQTIAIQVLKVANSAFYGGRVEIRSLKNAIVRLGRRKLRSIVFAIVMKTVILKGEEIDILARNLWRHSIACALLCEHLSKNVEIESDTGELFTCALIHDIHKVAVLALCRYSLDDLPGYFPGPEVLEIACRRFFAPIFKVLAKKWSLPETSVGIIINMDSFENNIAAPVATAVVSLANKLVKFEEKRIASRATLASELKILQLETANLDELFGYTQKLYRDIHTSF